MTFTHVFGCVYTGRKNQNLMHACKHKNSHEIQFFRIRSEPFPNVVLNQIHIRYLDTRATSKHISDSPQNSQYEGDAFAHEGF